MRRVIDAAANRMTDVFIVGLSLGIGVTMLIVISIALIIVALTP